MKKILFSLVLLFSLSASAQRVNRWYDSTWFAKGVQFDSTLVAKGLKISGIADTFVILQNSAGKFVRVGKNSFLSGVVGSGTVTDFIFTNGNGFTGTVGTSTTTPTLSLALDSITKFASVKRVLDSILAVRSIRKVDSIYKKSTNRDLTYFKINGTEYNFNDSIGSGVSQSALEDSIARIDSTISGYIPLSGTGDTAITGNLRFNGGQIIINGDGYNTVETQNDGGDGILLVSNGVSTLTHTPNSLGYTSTADPTEDKSLDFSGELITIGADNSSRGIGGFIDFSSNITDLDYTQKIYVDGQIADTASLLRSLIGSGGGSGTVTSIATNTGTGITGGTITSSGTLAIDTASTLVTKTFLSSSLSGIGGSSDFVLISTQTASSSATIDFIGLTSTYSSYKVVVSGVYPATNNAVLWMRIGTGGTPTYQSGASDYAYTSSVIPYAQIGGASGSVGGYASVADTKIVLSNPIKNAVLRPYNAEIKFYDPSQSASYHNIRAEACAWDSDTYLEGFFLNASYLSATSITAIRFLMSTGNIAGGTFKLYGIK